MSKRLTLYQRLKPEVKAGLESKSNERYKLSTDIIVGLLKSTQFYSDLTIDQVKNIIVFSDVKPKSVHDIKYGDFLLKDYED
tara:strand:- start:295 stop:540 length:246 start_codon:yes stop_codon:yes gene_type:complete